MKPIAFDRDKEKSLSNQKKHGISFEEAQTVFIKKTTWIPRAEARGWKVVPYVIPPACGRQALDAESRILCENLDSCFRRNDRLKNILKCHVRKHVVIYW